MPPKSLISIALLSSLLGFACGDEVRTGTLADVLPDTLDTVFPETSVPADTASDTSDVIPLRQCDPLAKPNGCEPDENCTYITADDFPRCIPSGPIPPGGKCDNDNRCAAGVCLAINQTANLCYQYCASDADCGGTEGSCLTLTNTPFKVCKISGIYDTCDLLAQDCAEAAKACYAVANEPEPICLNEGAGEPNTECNGPTSCKRGYACIAGLCRQLCDPTLENLCPNGDCRDFFDGAGYCFTF